MLSADREEVVSQGRERSTIAFPYDDLESAVGVARAVHELGGTCATDQLAAQLRYSSVENGAFRTRVATARTFGLVTTARDSIALSPLGHTIVDPSQEARGKADAFLNVPLYRAIHDRFKGTVLPPASGLERAFADLGVALKQTDKARQAFQRSAEFAGFFSYGKERLVAPSLGSAAKGDLEPIGRSRIGGESPVQQVRVPETRSSALDNSLIRGLFEQLPEPGADWSVDEQGQWVALAKAILSAVYKPPRPILPERTASQAEA